MLQIFVKIQILLKDVYSKLLYFSLFLMIMRMYSEAVFRALSFGEGGVKECSVFDCFQNDFYR